MKTLILTLLFTSSLIAAQAQGLRDTNFIESKVPAYTLPDVLKTRNNKAIKTSEDWEANRSALLTIFEDNIYGQMPKSFDDIKFAVEKEDKAAMQGKATLKEVVITVVKDNKAVKLKLVLFVPNNRKKAAPAFLLINNRGKEHMDPTRVTKSGFWPAEMLIDSGYAIAAFHVSDAAPDHRDTFMNGVLQLYPEQLQADNGMRAIGAWAWAASRVMDYFETDPAIDAKKVTVVGHSRGGKASLWAAAQDRRFAMCVSNNSGNTGAALSRRHFGESIKMINTSFPHWFNTNYKKFNDKEHLLPVDQHMLVALIAPRLIYATNASKDLWADPVGTFLALKQAEKVYALYGIKSLLPDLPPQINVPIVNAQLAYHNREGAHDLTPYDWNNFIKFANYHFSR
ncbi:acetylxylan esterase [Pedobacter immunditicola]|uniref:glucuronyl esterase domain-containing protein n=1 Tax=Pedobacter immunditicola TaxID=3133440 RepID=UPI0030A8428B